MTEKDYSLLRPFDPEAAKRGEAILDTDGDKARLVGVSSKGDEFCVELNDFGLVLAKADNLRMAPICWVEGRPVYRGDVLYSPDYGRGEIIENKQFVGGFAIRFESASVAIDSPYFDDGLTWTPPKVKREVKLLAFIDEQGFLRHVREELFCNRGVRVPHLDYLIPVEEPAEVAK